MNHDNVTPLPEPKTSKIKKISQFVRKHKLPLAITATAVTGLAVGYKLRDNSDQILSETAGALSGAADQLELVAENLSTTE